MFESGGNLKLAILRDTEHINGLTRAVLFCCAFNFFFETFQWQSYANRVLNLYTTSYFLCLKALGVGPGAQTRLQVRAFRVSFFFP